MGFLRQSTAGTLVLGPFLSNDTGTGRLTDLTLVPTDVYLSKNGAAFANKNDSGTASHGTLGFYHIPYDATDVNTVGDLEFLIAKGTSLDVWERFSVLPSGIYDWFIGTNTLDVGTAQNILANGDKTGYSMAADQSAVTVGTANAAASVPNPTGGTIDLSASVTNLTFDGTRVAANLESVEGNGDCDGKAWGTFFPFVLSYVAGRINKSGNDYAYRNQANTATWFTSTSSAGSRTVA